MERLLTGPTGGELRWSEIILVRVCIECRNGQKASTCIPIYHPWQGSSCTNLLSKLGTGPQSATCQAKCTVIGCLILHKQIINHQSADLVVSFCAFPAVTCEKHGCMPATSLCGPDNSL